MPHAYADRISVAFIPTVHSCKPCSRLMTREGTESLQWISVSTQVKNLIVGWSSSVECFLWKVPNGWIVPAITKY